jgi:hypothetical protein
MRITHVAPERLRLGPLRTEVVPLPIVTPTVAWVTHMVLRLCTLVPPPPMGLTAHQGLEMPVRMVRPNVAQNLGWQVCSSPHGELHGSLLLAALRVVWARD